MYIYSYIYTYIDTRGLIDDLLEDSRDHGPPELSSQASDFITFFSLQPGFSSRRAGGPVHLKTLQWNLGIGHGPMKWGAEQWTRHDFGNLIPLDPRMRTLLEDPRPDGDYESHQCLLLHVSAGCLRAAHPRGEMPTLAQAANQAALMRVELTWLAREAEVLLGNLPSLFTQAESDLRGFVHDAVRGHHDKDYRCLAAFPLFKVREFCLNFVRADSEGNITE
jgi:hypothetical protein